MKVRRSERLVDMTQYLLDHPHELISLTSFAERYESAKSSISEDLAIIKKTFKERGYGTLDAGISGVRAVPVFRASVPFRAVVSPAVHGRTDLSP